MHIPPLHWIKSLSLLVSLALGGGHASAAALAVTSYTDTNGTFTSLTIGGTAYTNLTGSTATLTGADTYFYPQGNPIFSGAGQANAAASGLDYRTGAGNVDYGSLFQFGRTITSQDYIFVTELQNGAATETVGFQLVNASNTVLGSYSISITPGQFGSPLISSSSYTVISNGTGGGTYTGPFGQYAVAFRLSDFTGTGDLSTATGIRFSSGTNNAWDPSVVGLAAAPDIDLTGHTLIFSDEFDSLSYATSSPKGSAKWYAGSPPNGAAGVYGNAARDPASFSVSGGILSNKLWLKTYLPVSGARCGGPVGMKTSAGTPMISLVVSGPQTNSNAYWPWYGWTGMKFTVGSSPVTVSQLGRYAITTNTQTHQVRIMDAATGADVAKTTVNCAGQSVSGFVYADIIGGNVTLQANKAYYLLTDNNSGGDMFFNTTTTVSATGGITVNESTWGIWKSGALYSVDATGAGFSQKYGYFEMRAKLPASGTGSWPSFWMKTTNDITHSGNVEEIDIFEWYGNTYSANPQKAQTQQASHNWIAGGGEDITTPHLSSPYTPIPGGAFPWAGYHIYGFKADPTYCTWYIDGVQTNRIATPTAYMANPFYTILEYSIGGGWPLDGLVANSKVEIDWIRVYSLP
ncbi:MAG: glycoside hydrolase family 16 protein [Terrimicrobiaceae bacterium]